MFSKITTVAGAASALCLTLAATGVDAQTPSAAAPTPTYGPALTGICVFNSDVALATSQAGVSANQQLSQLSQAAESELRPQRDRLVADVNALQAQKAKLPATQYQQRAGPLQDREVALQQAARVRNAQLARTRETAVNQIANAISPIITASITAHRCSIVFRRDGLIGSNTAMDLTPEVITRLNATLPTVRVVLATPQSVQGQP